MLIMRHTLMLCVTITICVPAFAQEWLQVIPQRAIFSITSNPQNPSSLLAGCYSRTALWSTDAGATWLELSIGEMGGVSQITALVFNPGDTNVLLAGGINFSGVDRSTDGGVTWENVLIDPEGNRFEVYSNGSFAFNPRNPDTVYALRTYPAIIYRSTNKGGRWDSIGAIPKLSTSARMKSLAICPQKDSAHIMLASGRPSSIYRSTNGGKTWAATGSNVSGQPDCDAVQIRWSTT
ncbi:MAG: WD40/YVTN/BNR-like repeat-containing protein, partial [Candidatus Kapaibacterium sp.]